MKEASLKKKKKKQERSQSQKDNYCMMPLMRYLDYSNAQKQVDVGDWKWGKGRLVSCLMGRDLKFQR